MLICNVLLNYNESLDHVFTLAHEMGHALHSYYSNQNQTYVNAGYRLFVAEVASTCNEALLIKDLLKKTEDKKKGKQNNPYHKELEDEVRKAEYQFIMPEFDLHM